jgi:hypothetical protein
VQRTGTTGVRNLITNPFFRTWTGASTVPPDDWEDDGGSFTDYCFARTRTRRTRPLPQLRRVLADLGRRAGVRVQTGVIYPQAIEGASFFALKCRVFFTEFSGSAWFYLQIRPGGGGDLIAGATLVSRNNLVQKGTDPPLGSGWTS